MKFIVIAFYCLSVIVILRQVIWVLNTKKELKVLNYLENSKNRPKPPLKRKRNRLFFELYFSWFFSVIITLTWLITGLFTISGYIFLGLIAYVAIDINLYNKNKRPKNVVFSKVNALITIAVALFGLINAFSWRIDLFIF